MQDFVKEISKVERTPLEVVELVRKLPLDFIPGSKALCSNFGYTLLGCVMNRCARKPMLRCSPRDYLSRSVWQIPVTTTPSHLFRR